MTLNIAASTASDHGAEQLVTCWPPFVPSLATKVAQPSVAALQDDTCVWPAAQDVWLVEHVHTSPVVQQTPLGSEHVVLLPVRSRAQWHVVVPSPEQVTCVQEQ